jgi:FeS assembly SUF system protein
MQPSVTDDHAPAEASVGGAAGPPLAGDAVERLREEVVLALKTVYDPEIPVNIYDLGLVYRTDVAPTGDVHIDMTLTAPGCPVAGEMPGWVENAINSVPGVGNVTVSMVFDPPWDQSRMSDEARVALDWY